MNAPHTCAWCGEAIALGDSQALLLPALGGFAPRFHIRCERALLAYCQDRRDCFAALKRPHGPGPTTTTAKNTGGSHDEG